MARKKLENMDEQELKAVLARETAAAAKAAEKHLMAAYEAALRLGHVGGFSAWLPLALIELTPAAREVSRQVPKGARRKVQYSPWHQGGK